MTPLKTIFIVATIGWTIASLYLSVRQSTFVRRHRDAVPADFAASHSLDEHRRAADYAQAREKLARWETIVDAAVALAWALGGIDLVYRALARAIPPSLGRGVAFLVAAGLVGAIVSLPFDVYRTFGLEQRFGFNRTNPRQFLLDRLKRGAISLALIVPLLFGLLFVMRTLTGLWWLWAWVAVVAIMMLAPTVYVRFIAPRFNRFEPLADGALRARIEAVLARSGFRSSGLFTMDASRRTAHGNAYFIGFGRTKRIVLFDTLIARCTPEEIEAVVAHELGHFLHRHVLFGLLRAAAMLFVAFAAFGWLTKQPWLLPAFGVGYQRRCARLFRLPAARLDHRPVVGADRQLDFAPQRVSSRRLRPPHRRRRADGERADPAHARQCLDPDAGPALFAGPPLSPDGPASRAEASRHGGFTANAWACLDK